MVDIPEHPQTAELIRLCDENKRLSEMVLTLQVRQRIAANARRTLAITDTMNDSVAFCR
jgi:hypothetical protein